MLLLASSAGRIGVLLAPPPSEDPDAAADETAANGTDAVQRTQKHSLEHTDDILCMAVSASGALIATGQAGAVPKIVVWSAATGRTLAVIQVNNAVHQ